MTPTDRAAEIGAEDGRKAAEAWLKLPRWHALDGADRWGLAVKDLDHGTIPAEWPIPDLSGVGTAWVRVAEPCGVDRNDPDAAILTIACADAYSTAFTAAVEQTIREAVKS